MFTVVLIHHGQLYWVIGPYDTQAEAERDAKTYRKITWSATVKAIRTPTFVNLAKCDA